MAVTSESNIRKSNLELTPSQNSAEKKLTEFFTGKKNTFILKGSAGTGKTEILKIIYDKIRSADIDCRAAAPTGRAAQILFSKGISNVSTIHKLIYKRDQLLTEETEDGVSYYFSLRENDLNSPSILLVDEASMISDKYAHNDLFKFGSGHLLKDLIEFAFSNKDTKIIFVGDDNQLPPIGMNFSPALSKNYLEKTYPSLSVESFELTEVIRQHKESSILSTATDIKEKLKRNDYRYIDLHYSDEIKEQQIHSLGDNFVHRYKCESNENIIISFTNAQVLDYNHLIRKRIFESPQQLNVNDRLVVTSNNYKYGLYNGEMVTVNDIITPTNTISIQLRGNDHKTFLFFREVNISCKDENFNEISQKVILIENLLDKSDANLSKEGRRALVADFRRRNPELKPNTDEYRRAISADPYVNALQVKYGYAITCHKSQGGEWENVFFDFNPEPMSPHTRDYFRFVYTAVTRAKKYLYAINPPKKSILNKKKIGDPPSQDRKSVDTEKSTIPEMKTFHDVLDEIRQTYNLEFKFKEMNFRIRCFYEYENVDKSFDVVYGGKNIIKSVDTKKSKGVDQRILDDLKSLRGKYLDNEKAEEEISVSAEDPRVNDIYEKIDSKLKDAGIKITDVKHLSYLERYTFYKDGIKSTVDLNYDKNFLITSLRPHRGITNKLYYEIEELLNGI